MNQNYLQFNQNAAALPRNIVAAQRRSCFKCRWEGDTAQIICPKCGKRLFTRTNIRVRGAVLIAVGLFLSGLMSAIAIAVTALIAQAVKQPNANFRLQEEPHLFVLMYVVFAGVIAAGAAATLNGIWMLIFGRRNMFLFYIFIALLVVAYVAGSFFTRFSN
jgi:hypothetical protein